MGACCSPSVERQLSAIVNDEIDRDKKKTGKVKKILFLGSGGSGKSTVFKSLRYIHGGGFSDNDKEEFIQYIHIQIIDQMKAILRIYIDYNHRKQQREKKIIHHDVNNNNNNYNNDDDDEYDELLRFDDFKLESSDLSNMSSAELVRDYKYDKNKHCLESDICSAIKTLWNEAIIREIYDLRNVTKIETSSAYFWDKLDEIQDANYLPSKEDILLCRRKTTGLHEQSFEIKGDIMHIIDVGGQRSQRRKWIHCFEYVVAVIFIASLSCYDEILEEDLLINTMSDQIELFDSICNNPSLCNVDMILFLNKTDLFHDKYCKNKIALNKCDKFEEYNDASFDYKKATDFIIKTFERLDRDEKKKIFTHLTRATDTNNIEKVFGDVQEIIIADSLKEAGLIDDGFE